MSSNLLQFYSTHERKRWDKKGDSLDLGGDFDFISFNTVEAEQIQA
jgi:hypothetical protein